MNKPTETSIEFQLHEKYLREQTYVAWQEEALDKGPCLTLAEIEI